MRTDIRTLERQTRTRTALGRDGSYLISYQERPPAAAISRDDDSPR